MTKLTVSRTLVYRSEDGSLTRYEIRKKLLHLRATAFSAFSACGVMPPFG